MFGMEETSADGGTGFQATVVGHDVVGTESLVATRPIHRPNGETNS